jgi:hypothetical protein
VPFALIRISREHDLVGPNISQQGETADRLHYRNTISLPSP